ncbi:MAG: helix-turn-helix domain-containing protein [Candidatus Peregrinibacteria bacterium]|nr:helix-turn-helix domain-containing protein [Candidatus Peregrinibacteria bacterium]MDZ4244795.1 helix-turn-helix domain-containing protein [Candidatus Gracilibacteria bacterium]
MNTATHRLSKVVKQLQQFGMSEKEAIIYTTLSELGPANIQDLANHSKINRSTTHVICEKLRQDGFIGESRKGKKRLIFVEDINKFRHQVEEEKFNLNMKEMTLNGLIPALQALHPTQKDRPLVRFYEGEEGFYEVCQRSLDKAKKEILFLGSMDDFLEAATEEYDSNHYIPTRLKKCINIRTLLFKDDETKSWPSNNTAILRETRFLPPEHKFLSTMFIYGDEFSLITSKAPFLGVVIESRELSNFMKNVFSIMWDKAVKI